MSDRQARLNSVEPHRSVIVQAPAGSGKTTLLVERYLGLLAVVEAPEEILAITFTRKAAAEMRSRVLGYLDPEFRTDEAHEQAPLAKARAVRDKVAGWRLRENPHRLMIRTIDSFNHYLARTMPVASALGPVPTPADDARALYRQAARNVLALVEGDDEMAQDIRLLLDWRDHRSQDIENLVASLLGKRDQWLRALSVTGVPQRARLESVLHSVVTSQLVEARQVLIDGLQEIGWSESELVELLRFAAGTLQADDRQSPIRGFVDAEDLPGADPRSLPLWVGLAEPMLTKGKPVRFRKNVSSQHGFPPNTEERKRFQSLLAALADNETLSNALNRARSLPRPQYSDQEWAVLGSLVRVLNRTAAELAYVFARSNHTDFTGLAAAALRGLGDEETGFTDLGLYLDRRITHLLVDEFQDTNWAQLHLLEKLTAGWESGDGRSLFLVGDPMQSIYRFREAEVGLFIRSRDQGIGSVALQSERLTRNFRSRREIVDWVNGRLGPIFPETEDISAGAIAYAASESGRAAGGAVETLAYPTEVAEAQAIVALVSRALADHAADPDFKAAIIVRARSHLKEILPALGRARVAYRAVKLDPLIGRGVVQDLLALTRAILQPADVAAVLALLRSPVCGLTLADLHALAGDGRSPFEPDAIDRLGAEAQRRAGRVVTVLRDAQQQLRRRSIRDLVEGAWHRLGGPACCRNPETAHRDAAMYLDAVDQAASNGLLEDWNDFVELLQGEYTEGDPPSESVKLEILTMHGAKGLEWDLVILPGLNKPPGGAEGALLHWLPFTADNGDEQVLMAPLRASVQASDPPLVELIRSERKSRAAFENQRLLYVATTRAREHLVLSACLDPDKANIKPIAGTLLAALWPTTHEEFLTALEIAAAAGDVKADADTPFDQTLRRIDADWQPPLAARLNWKPGIPVAERDVDIEYNWAGMQARRTGTVLHRLLEVVARVGIESFSAAERQRLIGKIPQLLKAMGSRDDGLAQTVEIISDAFERTLDHETGQWLLSNRHTDAACELALAGVIDGQLVNAVVDRTFVDADGVRWIIDYKSGYHAGTELDEFLAQERERYQAQLGRYRRLFEQMETRTVKTALYLPRHCRLQVI
ncbi:MAG: UvrD-helicase domain-containing protein [Gammaproteobacteria bacterium]|nr:UvrD-helicase domain-containing protein [Gammaproteobacteria bacterium]